ncbi:hypothetical protein LAUMK41_03549 [Mycobacterium attenuatum]|uniref:Uncharacterized protein n=1 Tax=Mycobacterium attenuatum TaxID=2341086 RepID=A0A498Q710_9MYCO|nr:hypothetical protein LAUMK136_03477 [Mycobacterium attenuatum]VBA59558.1 hypothetical protein LAUMK41_03549 [Mycobacterium attenuatum]
MAARQLRITQSVGHTLDINRHYCFIDSLN